MTTLSDHDPSGPGLDERHPGQELRVARERAGISRDSMAERLCLAAAQLDALERDDYTELPPPAFVRGYFRGYARELGLDPDEYIAAYNRGGVASGDPAIRHGGVNDTPSGGRGGMIGLLLIGLVALGGVGAWWYQQRMIDGNGVADSVEEERTGTDDTDTGGAQDPATNDRDTGDGTASGDVERDAGSNADADADAETTSVDVEAAVATFAAANGADGVDEETRQPTVAAPDREAPESGGDDAAGDGTETAEAGNPGTGSGTEEDAGDDAAAAEEGGGDEGADSTADDEPGATSPAATDSPARAATEAASAGPDEITLEFSSRSWLEVYDDRDRELVYTLYFGSEPITLQGWAPFEIFLGNSPAVTVRLNGETIDKSAFNRSNNTARFVVDAAGVRAP